MLCSFTGLCKVFNRRVSLQKIQCLADVKLKDTGPDLQAESESMAQCKCLRDGTLSLIVLTYELPLHLEFLMQ